ncbi:MAG: hypothetical protein AAFR59_10510, partial [Bacteroidota bacterium]
MGDKENLPTDKPFGRNPFSWVHIAKNSINSAYQVWKLWLLCCVIGPPMQFQTGKLSVNPYFAAKFY